MGERYDRERVMALLPAFLPPHLEKALARASRRAPPWRDRIAGAYLLSDISGFTALTEKLEAGGRAGAEEIALVVTNALRPAILAIERWNGSIVSFGGDALFSLFAGRDGARRAAMAARDVGASFARRPVVSTTAGPHTLAISQAIHAGIAWGFHLGTRERRHHVVSGPAVAALARIQARVAPGGLAISAVARAAMARRGPAERPRRGPLPSDPARLYVPEKVARVLPRFRGAYREAAILFLETRGARLQALQVFFLTLDRILATYDGTLLKTDLSRDGIKWLCAFGIPAAHEDAAERAARAAVALRAGTPRGLGIRGALHAGTVVNVVVGTSSRRSFDVMGDVVNVAARALSAAAWGEMVATAATLRRVPGVDAETRGAHAFKGKSRPIELGCLLGFAGRGTKRGSSVPLVGRAEELGAITRALASAARGRGRAIAIQGDAGMGKSRIAREAGARARAMGFDVREGRAISFGGMPYWVFSDLVRQMLAVEEGAPRAAVLERVSEAARELELPAATAHHLGNLLGFRHAASPLDQLDARAIRLSAGLAVRDLVRATAMRRPLLVILEDMHWADEPSRELAAMLCRDAPSTALGVLILHRPGYEPPPGARAMRLPPLRRGAVEKLLASVAGAAGEAIARHVTERAEGNPFYVEEMVRNLRESGLIAESEGRSHLTRPPTTDDMPPSIEALIEARLDRLTPEARMAAAIGSVIGRSFLHDVLAGVMGKGASRAVDELCARDVVAVKEAQPRELIFTQAMTRDVAYRTILVSRRRRLHAAVADSIERRFAREIDRYLGMLAHHRERGGQVVQARAAYLGAARRAAGLHVHEEAETLYRSYLRLAARPAERVAAQNELGARVLTIRGRLAEAMQVHRQALADATALDLDRHVATSMRMIGLIHRDRGEHGRALAMLLRSQAIFHHHRDASSEALALGNIGNVHREQGRMDEARAAFRQALAIHRELGETARIGAALGNLASVSLELGQTHEALDLYRQALAIHRAARDRAGEGVALSNLSTLERELGNVARSLELSQEALAIHRDVGHRKNEAIVLANLAITHLDCGHETEAAALFPQALAALRDVGDRRSQATVLGNLGLLHGARGANRRALRTIEEGVALARETGDALALGVMLGNVSMFALELARTDRALQSAAEALRIATETGDVKTQGIALYRLGRAHRHLGAFDDAARDLARSLAILEPEGYPELVECLCERGHLALAAGEAADPAATCRDLLSRATAHVAGTVPTIANRKAIARLHAAVAAFEAGASLVRGECVSAALPKGRARRAHGSSASGASEVAFQRAQVASRRGSRAPAGSRS
ncbi:MAG: tetratricopeptide repeat protein [Acidobacteriota bacterium]